MARSEPWLAGRWLSVAVSRPPSPSRRCRGGSTRDSPKPTTSASRRPPAANAGAAPGAANRTPGWPIRAPGDRTALPRRPALFADARGRYEGRGGPRASGWPPYVTNARSGVRVGSHASGVTMVRGSPVSPTTIDPHEGTGAGRVSAGGGLAAQRGSDPKVAGQVFEAPEREIRGGHPAHRRLET